MGQARHIYASIIGLQRAFRRLSPARRAKAKMHLTLSDVHPTVLCRDLIALMLLRLLVQGQLSREEAYEVKLALHYSFCLHLVPEIALKW